MTIAATYKWMAIKAARKRKRRLLITGYAHRKFMGAKKCAGKKGSGGGALYT